MKELYCPFMLMSGKVEDVLCRKEYCAWWLDDRKECAIHALGEIREKLDSLIDIFEKTFWQKGEQP